MTPQRAVRRAAIASRLGQHGKTAAAGIVVVYVHIVTGIVNKPSAACSVSLLCLLLFSSNLFRPIATATITPPPLPLQLSIKEGEISTGPVKQSKSFDIERKIKIVYLDEDLRIARYAAAVGPDSRGG
jgi:hypothetical protein